MVAAAVPDVRAEAEYRPVTDAEMAEFEEHFG
jgi:hypothetical protein